MQELADMALLREYVERDSHEAFAVLIARHLNKVYSAALRHTRNPHQAEEITQAVFVILAQKARGLGRGVILSGWLYQTARLTALTFIRGEIRRARREQEAHMQTIVDEDESVVWTPIAPLLDAAMGELNETDRHAVVLRYFDGKSMREVGGALGASEEAAKKRVNRAVEKLQKFFRKRGIDSSATGIAGAISNYSVQTAPAALAKLVTAAAISKGAAVSSSTLTLIKGALKTMAWTKMKFALAATVCVLLAAGGGTAIYATHRNLQKETDDSSAAPATMAGPAEMRIKWIVGKKYEMRMEFTQSTETKLPNQPVPMKMEVNFAQNIEISPLKELGNGGRQLDLQFVNEKMEVTQGGRTILSLNSAQGTPDAKNPASAVSGAHVQYLTDAQARVESVQGGDELMQRIATSPKSEEQSIFKQMFTEDLLKQYASFGDVMPNRVVKLGESWQVKKEVGTSAGKLMVNVKYTFKNWERHGDRDCAHILAVGEISTKSISTASGAAIQIQKGKISGDVWFDPVLGLIVDASSDQTMTMKVSTQTQTLMPELRQKTQATLVGLQ